MLGLTRQHAQPEPMTALFDEAHPRSLFFFTRKDNRLVAGMPAAGPAAQAQFASKGHELFACLRGKLSRSDDPKLIDEFWSPAVAAWFEDGRRDEMLQLLRFDIEEVELWRAHVPLKGRLQMLFGGTIDQEAVEENHVHAAL
jgi:general stress protein 26